MINTKRLASTLLDTVRNWVEPAFRAVNDRLDDFDARLKSIPAGEPGRDGVDVDMQAVERRVAEFLAQIPAPRDGAPGKDGEPGPAGAPGLNGAPGKDGEPPHPDTIARMVFDAVRVAVKDIPAPLDGKDGRDADPELVRSMVEASVTLAIASIPKPKDGEPGVPGRDADPEFIRAEVAKAFAALPAPRDGKDGEAGADGKDADPAVMEQAIADATARINREFVDMADELVRGLEGAAAELPATPALSLNFSMPGQDPARKSTAGSVREQTVLAGVLAETIRETLMLPVKPVYDSSGKLLYGQRVAPSEAQ